MKVALTSTTFTVLCLLFLVSFDSFKAPNEIARETEIQSFPVVDFLNSIGVNAAVSQRGESLEKTIEITKYLGIKWIRSGYEGGLPVSDLVTLHNQTGLRFSYGLLSGGTDIPRLLAGARQLAANKALLAFEGPNEPNNWGFKYNDSAGGKDATWLPVAHLQRDLYAGVKNDPALKDYAVWNSSENGAETNNVGLQFLEIPKGAGTLMPEGTKYADYANCHNYFMHPSHPGIYDNQTWNAADPGSACKVDGLYGNYGLTWRHKFTGYSEKDLVDLPRVTTETGAVMAGDLTEEKQAVLFLDLYLAQFKRGWSYTALYLLRDRSDEAGNQQYGFYKADYTPRKSAVYFHNMTTVLGDKGSVKAPGKLAYSILNRPGTVHDLLLQKSNGTFEMVVWGEKFSGDLDNITISLGKRAKSIKVFDPTIGTHAIRIIRNINSVSLAIKDHPVIMEIEK